MQSELQLSKKWVVIVITFTLVLLNLIWRGISSGSGRASNRWLYDSPEVRALIGSVRDIEVTEHVESIFPARAQYWVNVEGPRGNLRAHLELVKVDDHWVVAKHEFWQ